MLFPTVVSKLGIYSLQKISISDWNSLILGKHYKMMGGKKNSFFHSVHYLAVSFPLSLKPGEVFDLQPQNFNFFFFLNSTRL